MSDCLSDCLSVCLSVLFYLVLSYDQVMSQSPAEASMSDMKTFTICIGKRETPADLFLTDVPEAEALLTRLSLSPSTVVPMEHDVVMVE